MKAYRACLFDLYGTLVDIRTDEGRPGLWRQMSAHYGSRGARYAPAELRAAYLAACARREAELRQSSAAKWVEIEIGAVFSDLYARRGAAVDASEIQETAALFRRLSTTHLRAYAGAAELLRILRERGRQVILLSNAQRLFTLPELEKLGLRDCFDGIFLSSDHGCKKPDAAFFRLPLERFGLAPEDCLMIGNDPVCDVAGAAAVGIDSVYIRSGLSPRDEPEHIPALLRLDRMDLRRLRRILLAAG